MDLWSHLGSGLLQLGLILVLLFWIVGAYNRLMRLRNALAAAWAPIDDLLLRRATALDMLVAAARDTLVEEANSLQALVLAQDKHSQASAAVRAKPASAERLAAWSAAELALSSPMARLHALVEQHAELDASPGVRPARLQLADLAARLGYAKQTFNEAVDQYNAAVHEWPTRLVVELFRFTPAARI